MSRGWGHPKWTLPKLDAVREYLESYQKALSNTPFHRVYIDGFAGSGQLDFSHLERAEQPALREWEGEGELFQTILDGSVRQALKLANPFHEYIFIEKSPGKANKLRQLESEFPDRTIRIVNQDVNSYLRSICGGRWINKRAVLFLDPYGMSLEWDTLKAIAQTQAIDLWYLYPISTVNRLLSRTGATSETVRQRLNLIHGGQDWVQEFYRQRVQTDLFDTAEVTEKFGGFDRISRFFVDRLKTLFTSGAVADPPLMLRNTRNCPLFLLCFASGNSKGAPIARRIAKHIIEKASF